MDIITHLTTTTNPHLSPIHTLDMHTSGEPTRIILHGHPPLRGTLLQQRAQAATHHDHIRRRLLLEPRGHGDMYGAWLCRSTELVDVGEAHIGVLFMTAGGWSTMCGHATVALGRFLVDTWDEEVFPGRGRVEVMEEGGGRGMARVMLHAPCGLVEVMVPVLEGGRRSDPSRQVSFVGVPSFASGVGVTIEVPDGKRWKELGGRTSVLVDFAYGGTFYCLVPASELGFERGLRKVDIEAMNRATRNLKAAIVEDQRYQHFFRHPEHEDLSFLYSIMVVDKSLGRPSEGAEGAETGLCFFSDQQIDRSPTGSAVAAREALAIAKRERRIGQKWTYHSLVSNASEGRGGFDGEFVEIEGEQAGFPVVRVRVSGIASYTGASTFFVEEEDVLGDDGFVFEKLVV